jgi:hypothetical protein
MLTIINIIFAKILIVLAADYYFDHHTQGSFVANNKCVLDFWMHYHVFLYSSTLALALYFTFHVSPLYFFVIYFTHKVIDHKSKCEGKLNDWQDKYLHLAVILIPVVIMIICQLIKI